MRNRARSYGDERGSSIVEFALVVPVFYLLLFGCVQFSMIFFAYCNITYASRLAMRYAVVHGSGSTAPCSAADLRNLITPYLWAVPTSSLSITSSWNPDNAPGGTVTISISSQFSGIPFSSLRTIPFGVTTYGYVLQ